MARAHVSEYRTGGWRRSVRFVSREGRMERRWCNLLDSAAIPCDLGHVRIVPSIRRVAWGLAIGLIVSVVAALLHVWGVFDRFELDALDLRFRHFNNMPSSDLIVHIDIDDSALERIHRWPWPRRLHAQLIDTLGELGARAVVMDIVFAEEQPPRLPLPPVDSAEELAEKVPVMTAADAILDDQELRGAIARAGNVYLSMFFQPSVEALPIGQLEMKVRRTYEQNPSLSLQELMDRVRNEGGVGGTAPQVLRDIARRVQLEAILTDRFGLGVDELAHRTGMDRSEIDRVLAGIKERVAGHLVRRVLASRPGCRPEQIIEEVLAHSGRDPLDVRDLLTACKTERATQATLARCPLIPPDRQPFCLSVATVTPPLIGLAEAARENAFVTFEPVSGDGVLREIPLVACYRGRMLRQLAFAAVCDVLEVPPERVELMEPKRMVLRGARRPGESVRRDVLIPLDERGRLLLNWSRPSGRWERSFTHVAVGRVLEIPLNRDAVRTARQLGRHHLRAARARAVRFITRDAAAAYEDYVRLLEQRSQLEQRLSALAVDDPRGSEHSRQITDVEARIATIEERAAEAVRRLHAEIGTTQPMDDDERREFDQIRRLYRDLFEPPPARIDDRASQLEQRVAERIEELRPIVHGKVCFVGYTATAVADFVTTPVFDRVPGVVVHSNLFNTVYTGQFVRRAPRGVNVALIVGLGLLAGLITTRQGPIVSLLTAAVAINLGFVGVALALFYVWQVWIVVPTVVSAVLVSWALITVYRQLTEGRDKRLAFSRLGQYTSRALARRIAEDPGALHRAEVRDVTCFFSDLKGFTPLSEGLGAERTQAVLNLYLERMSEVLDRYEAFINKFLGDGIFAFFNPVVNPQPDHIRLACEAALDSLTALEELVAEQQRHGGDEAFAQLRCRIGLASGRVVVGNCGSERKFDYTCIGDTVNLAARLESANKAFGSRIMVAESTRTGTADLYEWRYLGGLQVVGKRQMVPVYELLGRKGTVPDETLEFAARFEQGVRLYQEQRWVDGITHFARMLARRPDDPGLMLYMDRCRQFQRFGPPEDWTGAIELTEK